MRDSGGLTAGQTMEMGGNMNSNLMRKGMAIAALAGLMAVSTATKTEAAFIAYICDDALCAGGNDISITDNGGALDEDPTLGAIELSPSGGAFGYNITINIAQSKPVLANGMDLAYVVTRSATNPGDPGPIWLFASDTGFAGPQSLAGSLGGTRDNGTVQAIICDGDATQNFSPCSSSVTAPGSGSFTLAVNHAATTNPYVLTLGVRIDLTGPGTSTGDFRVIPEPATLALFGLGLAVVAARRRRQNA